MTRLSNSRPSRTVALAVVASAGLGAGVLAPVVNHVSFGTMSIGTAFVEAATGNSFTLTKPVALPLFPNIMIETGTLSVSDPGTQRRLGAAEALALLTHGSANLVLDDAVLSLAPTQSADPLAPDSSQSMAPLLQALMKLSFTNLELRKAHLRLGRGNGEHATLSNVTLDVTKTNATKAKAIGSFEYRGQKVSFEINMGTEAQLQASMPKGSAAIGRALDIKVVSEVINFSAAGTLSAGDEPQLSATTSEVEIANLRQFAGWIGLDFGNGSSLGTFKASGPLEFSPRSIAFSEAKFELDSHPATGTLTFKWGGARPSVDGTLAFTTFNITPYLVPPSQKLETAFNISRFFAAPHMESPQFPIVGQIDADLRISTGEVTLGLSKFGRAAASLSLKDGVLLADLAEFELANGGRCGGQFGFKIKDRIPNYSLSGKIEAADVALLSNALWSYSFVSGMDDVIFDLKDYGESADKILGTLGGKVAIRQQGSGQIALDLRTLAATARAQTQKGWGGAIRGQTTLEGLIGEFKVTEGTLTAENVGARAGDASLTMTGILNFPEQFGDIKMWITHPPKGAENDPVGQAAPGIPPVQNSTFAFAPATAVDRADGTKSKVSGGGLHILGPFARPEIRFIPLDQPAVGAMPESVPPAASTAKN